jgi:hypothetical protein
MLAYVFVIFAVAMRFLPHPLAFTPVTAALLFFGARGSRKQLWVPLLLMAASDVVLTKFYYAYPLTADHVISWAYYAAILWLGTKLGRDAKPLPILGAALGSSVLFFIVSNFGAWATWTDMYPRTFNGLMLAYDAGLPFFRRSVEGDLLFTAAFFAAPMVLKAMAGALEKTDRSAAA